MRQDRGWVIAGAAALLGLACALHVEPAPTEVHDPGAQVAAPAEPPPADAALTPAAREPKIPDEDARRLAQAMTTLRFDLTVVSRHEIGARVDADVRGVLEAIADQDAWSVAGMRSRMPSAAWRAEFDRRVRSRFAVEHAHFLRVHFAPVGDDDQERAESAWATHADERGAGLIASARAWLQRTTRSPSHIRQTAPHRELSYFLVATAERREALGSSSARRSIDAVVDRSAQALAALDSFPLHGRLAALDRMPRVALASSR